MIFEKPPSTRRASPFPSCEKHPGFLPGAECIRCQVLAAEAARAERLGRQLAIAGSVNSTRGRGRKGG